MLYCPFNRSSHLLLLEEEGGGGGGGEGGAREDNPPTLEAEIMELQAKAAPTPGPAPAGNEPEPEYIRQFKGLYRPDPNAQDSECGKPQPYIRARNDDSYGNQPINYREREANRSTAGYNGTLLTCRKRLKKPSG